MWARICILVSGFTNMNGKPVFLRLFFNHNLFSKRNKICVFCMAHRSYFNLNVNTTYYQKQNSGYKASNRHIKGESKNQYLVFIFTEMTIFRGGSY